MATHGLAEPSSDGGRETERPTPAKFAAGPGPLLIASLALAASAALFIPTTVLAHYAGYVCASLISFSAVAINRRAVVSTAAKSSASVSAASKVISVVILLAGIALAIGHAWFIARYYG